MAHRPPKRAKLESSAATAAAQPADEPMTPEGEDPLLAIAAFMAPTTRPTVKVQPSFAFTPNSPATASRQSKQEEEDEPPTPSGDAAGAASSPPAKRAAPSPSPSMDIKPPRARRRGREQDEPDGEEEVARAAEKKKKENKRKNRPTTERLTYTSHHGLLASSLPLLCAVTRERLLEHNLPAAAEALERLYPAYKLDIDTVFKTTVEVLESQQQRRRGDDDDDDEGGAKKESQHADDDPYGDRADGGPADGHQQLTRFYKKLLHQQPKNLIQLVFELTFLYLESGQLQSAWDHLSNWVQSHQFTHAKTGDLRAAKQASGLLGVIAWECSKAASAEAKFWQEKIHRRQEGESDSEVDSVDMNRRVRELSSHTLSRARAQSTSELLVELRTSTQKAASFEKLARQKLKAAVAAEPANQVWIWYYVECMEEFFRLALPIHVGPLPQHGGDGGAAGALAAAQSRVQSNRTKLCLLHHRLLRKIDEHIVATPGQTAGWTMKLHYLDVFSPTLALAPPSSATNPRMMAYLAARHLLVLDPVSNVAMQRMWRLWVEQGEQELLLHRPSGEGAAAASASAEPEPWCVRALDLVDLVAARLDVYPREDWSWLVLVRLLASLLQVDGTPIDEWPIDGFGSSHAPDDIASLPGTPMLRSAIVQPATRSDSESSASSTPRRQKKTSQVKVELPRPSAAADSGAESVPDSPAFPPQRSASLMSDASSLAGGTAASLSSSKLGGDLPQGKSAAAKVFAHNQLASLLPHLSESSDRRHARWLGRIEWWVQASGWWRGVAQIRPEEIARHHQRLPTDQPAKNLLLRGVCYSLVLQWMGWTR